MDDQSIWKKEIHLRRGSADTRQSTPPAASGKKESIWRREISFRKGDSQAEAVETAAVAEAPVAQAEVAAPVAVEHPVVPPQPIAPPEPHYAAVPEPVVMAQPLVAAQPVAPVEPRVEAAPVAKPEPVVAAEPVASVESVVIPEAFVAPEPVVAGEPSPVVPVPRVFEPAPAPSEPAPTHGFSSGMVPVSQYPAEPLPADWNDPPVDSAGATEPVPADEATQFGWSAPDPLPADEAVQYGWSAPGSDASPAFVEPAVPHWSEPVSDTKPAEPDAPSWDSRLVPPESAAASWNSQAAPPAPVAHPSDSHAGQPAPLTWNAPAEPVFDEPVAEYGQPEFGAPAELPLPRTPEASAAQPAAPEYEAPEEASSPSNDFDADPFASPPRAPWEDELDDEVEAHGSSHVAGMVDEPEPEPEPEREPEPEPEPEPEREPEAAFEPETRWEPEVPTAWSPVPPPTMSGPELEVEEVHPAHFEPAAVEPLVVDPIPVEPVAAEPFAAEPFASESLAVPVLQEISQFEARVQSEPTPPAAEAAPLEPVTEAADAPEPEPVPAPETDHGTEALTVVAAAAAAGAVVSAAVDSPKKRGLKRELRLPSRKEKGKSEGKGKPKNKAKSKDKGSADDQSAKGKGKAKGEAKEAANGLSAGAPKHAVKNVVGLRIGSSQLAAARIHNNGTAELVQVARTPLARGIVSGGEVRDPAALTRSLKKFFAENKLPRRGVRLGIASNRIGVRMLEVPKVDDKKLFDNSVRFHAQETLPIAVSEAIIDYVVLGETVGEGPETLVRILLVFAHRELVDSHLEACRRAGLKLDGVDLEAFALLRALAAPLPDGTEATSAVVAVAVGQERTIFAVSDGRVCDFTRVLEWGGGAMDVAIARALDLTPSQAEPIKMQLSLDGESAPTDLTPEATEAATTAARNELQVLSRELVASLQFYQSRPGSLDIGEILLSGGAAEMSGFAEELEQLIGVPVKVGDPFSRVVVGRKVTRPDEVGSLAVAIGLGIED